jgi:hypothetical protein
MGRTRTYGTTACIRCCARLLQTSVTPADVSKPENLTHLQLLPAVADAAEDVLDVQLAVGVVRGLGDGRGAPRVLARLDRLPDQQLGLLHLCVSQKLFRNMLQAGCMSSPRCDIPALGHSDVIAQEMLCVSQ